MNKTSMEKYYGGNPIDNFSKGKLARMQFIVSTLTLMVIMGILVFLFISFLGLKSGEASELYKIASSPKALIFAAIFVIVYYAFLFSFVTKRLRDMAQNPWWSLLLLVPYINLVLALFLIFVPSKNPATQGTPTE